MEEKTDSMSSGQSVPTYAYIGYSMFLLDKTLDYSAIYSARNQSPGPILKTCIVLFQISHAYMQEKHLCCK